MLTAEFASLPAPGVDCLDMIAIPVYIDAALTMLASSNARSATSRIETVANRDAGWRFN